MIQFTNAVDYFSKIILTELKEAKIRLSPNDVDGITCWIAGGCVRDYFMGIPMKTDFDIFFPDQKNHDKCVRFFKNKESAGEAKITWESDNGMKVKYNGKTFDIIKHFFADPNATINAFDFTVSMFAVDTSMVYQGGTSFIDLAKRQLMINKITYPASTMSRAFRYYSKGFRMCKGEMAKIVLAIQDMPKPEPKPEDEQGSEGGQNPPSGDVAGMFIGID